MRIYLADSRSFHATQAEAHQAAKPFGAGTLVEELEIPTDKAGVLSILNGGPYKWVLIRSFNVTKRGGLQIAGSDDEPTTLPVVQQEERTPSRMTGNPAKIWAKVFRGLSIGVQS